MPGEHVTQRIGAPAPIARIYEGALLPGTQVAQSKTFEIVERLGEGGMGDIYKAYDKTMDRYIALKILKPGMPESEQRRFHREAVIAANFSHPNLVRVLEVGQTQDMHWLAMEYLRGKDVADIVIRRKRISFRVAVDIFAQTLDALSYIHTRSIAHCDIKPENIFITRDAYDRRLVIVKLIDFGIARDLDGPLELSEFISGDPRYMAPEQAQVNSRIDGRADLYALALTFWETLACQHPHEDAFDLDPTPLLEYRLTHEIPALSPYMPEGTPLRLAEALDEFMDRALAPNPALRHKDAAHMKAELEGLLRFLK